jgi:hypothetical protein
MRKMTTPATAAQLSPSVFDVFRKFINQRPGLDPRNYISDWRDKEGRRAYQSEARRIQNDGAKARQALELASAYPFNAQALLDATRAYSGRLQIVAKDSEAAYAIAIDYCTGQYWPTEYRAAAAAVLERYCEEIRPKTITGRIPRTVAELKEIAREAGSHFFDRSALRFFNSQILPSLYVGPGGVYFVTSEQFEERSQRKCTVRQFQPETADIRTVGQFNELTREDALSLARSAAKGQAVAA